MTFPVVPLEHEMALLIDGVWTDITDAVYARNGGGVSIDYGIRNEGSKTDPARMTFELDDRNGDFTTKNPSSPYWGKIRRGTPIRYSVFAGSVYADIPNGGILSTPDNAALDITGDLDVRIEIDPDIDMLPDMVLTPIPGSIEIIAKDNGTTQRSWLLMMRSGRLRLEWSADGSNVLGADATDFVRILPDRPMALRFTIDVNNGAAGRTITFYKSDSINGTWEQIGDPVVQAGTTSIFNSTSPLAIGNASGAGLLRFIGKLYKAEVRNGINGTVVANPDLTLQTPGATSFADAAGRTWTASAGLTITNRNIRFKGNVISWPVRWQTGSLDAHVQVEAAGPLRRIGQGQSPLHSALYREYTKSTRTGILDYWSMEEGTEASSFANSEEGRYAMRFTGDVALSSFDTYPPTEPLPVFGAGSVTGTVAPYTSTGEFAFRTFVQLSSTPPSAQCSLVGLKCSGTAKQIVVRLNTTNQLALIVYDEDNVVIATTGFFTYYDSSVPTQILVEMTQNGADIDFTMHVYDCRDYEDPGIRETFITLTAPATTFGRVTSAHVGAGVFSLEGVAAGQMVLTNDLNAFAGTGAAMLAWRTEQATARYRRVAHEDQQPVKTYPGVYPATNPATKMGAQGELTRLGLFSECEDVSGGFLFEDRESDAIVLRDAANIYSAPTRITLDYTGDNGLVTPLDPEEDDQNLINDMTANQISGSSYRYQKTTGTLNTNYPETDPEGAGPYESSAEFDVWRPEQLIQFATWAVHLGTWDEWRFPKVTVLLQKDPDLIDAATHVVPGDMLEIINMPDFTPPDDAKLMLLGYSEFVSQYRWEFTYNCQPGRPWDIAVVEDETLGRADTDGSELAEALDTTETAVDVYVTDGPAWIDTANFSSMFPFDVIAGGERMTVSAITDTVTDTFTRSVSNGWGTPDIGSAWTTVAGAASDYSVNGTVGRHAQNTLNVLRHTLTTAPSADVDVYVDWAIDKSAITDSNYVFLPVRYTDTTHMYIARIQVVTGTQAFNLQVRKRDTSETQLGGTVALGTYTPGVIYRLRFQVFGSDLKAKCWLASDVEPEVWQIETTDTALTAAGSVGCRSFVGATSTQTLPITASFDNFRVVNPQRFTVTRSVNGVVKSHDVGTPISLFNPMRAGL